MNKTSTIEKIENGEFELWLHQGQKNGWIKGEEIYTYLKENNLLEDCASVEDLIEIKKQGINFFKKHFAEKYIYAWKSVVRCGGRSLYVPFLYGGSGRVVLGWRWLERVWHDNDPALRLVSSPQPLDPQDFAIRLSALESDMAKIKKFLII